MAKRRINQKFLALLGGSVLALAALGVGALKFRSILFPKHPEKFLAAGRDELANKDYATALDNLRRAAGLMPPDSALDVMIGDAFNGLSSVDPDNLTAARGMWEQAVAIKADNTDAMQRLIQFWHDQLELQPRAKDRLLIAQQLQKNAGRILAVQPGSHFGREMNAEATIEILMAGIENDSVHQDMASAAEQTLNELATEDPKDSDLPFYAAHAYLWQAQQAAAVGDDQNRQRLIDAATQVMEHAEAQQPDNAEMHYRMGNILLQVSSGRTGGKSGSADVSPEVKQTVIRAVQEVDQARQLVKPEDPRYVEISLYDARLVLDRPSYTPIPPPVTSVATGTALSPSSGDAPAISNSITPAAANRSRVLVAESIYRDVLSHLPNDPSTRLALAGLLGNMSGRRDEAIALLKQPLIDDHPQPGIKGTLLPLYQSQCNIRLLQFEIDAVEASHDPVQRASLLSTADELCDRVYGKSGDKPEVLGLKGRLQLVHGQVSEATQTLRRALELVDPQDNSQRLLRNELMFSLARADEAAQQTGDAKKLASEITAPDQYPHFIPARLMLARLLVAEHDIAGAEPHIDYLESIVPQHPELRSIVARLRIATLDSANDADRIKQYYASLPEKTRQQRMEKASFAHMEKFDDDFLRLMNLVHTDSPGDAECAHILIAWYNQHQQPQLALQVLHESLAANPSDSTLLELQMQLEGTPSEATANSGSSQQQGDSFANEWAQVQLARTKGDVAGVDAHLAAAEKLHPDDPQVWDAIFTRSLESAEWDRASIYLEKLASGNIDHADGALYRIRYFNARSNTQKVYELALQLTRDKPEFSKSWTELGKAQQQEGKYREAIDNFRHAISLQTQNVDALRGLVECSYALGNNDQAKQYIDQARKVAPADQSVKDMAENYELTYGDPRNVVPELLAALQSFPQNQQNWLNLANAYIAAAKSRAKAQDNDGAADYYQKLGDLLQQGAAKFPDSSKFVVFQAKVALERGDYAGAQNVMLQFAQQPGQQGRPRTAMLLSEFYEQASKPDLATKVLSDYLAAPFQQPADIPADISVQLRLSNLLANTGRADEALAALSAHASDPSIVRQRIAVLIITKRFDQALAALNDLAASAPLNPDFEGLKGVALMNSGKFVEAKACFDEVLTAQPNNTDALTRRAQVELRSVPPDLSAAVGDLTRARDLAPDNMETRLALADAQMRLQDPASAAGELEAAVRAAPTNKQIRLRLIDLYAKSDPPRWQDASKLISETEQMPSLANDPDVLHEEAFVDMQEGQLDRADQVIRTAMASQPGNWEMVHTFYDILLKNKGYDELLSNSAKLLGDNQNASSFWWVRPYRAQAILAGNGDRTATAAELDSGLSGAIAAQDVAGESQIVQTYATLLGPDAAISAAGDHSSADPHLLVVAADLCAKKNDPDAALKWLGMALDQVAHLQQADQELTYRMAAEQNLVKVPPEPAKSADFYRQLLKISPNDLVALNNLACILVEPLNGAAFNPKEALEHSEQAYNLMRNAGLDEPMIRDTYGWALITNNQGDQLTDGMKLVTQALQKRDFAEGHYHLAEAYLSMKPRSQDDAIRELNKARTLLEEDESEGKHVDIELKSHVLDEIKKTQSALAG
jgi:tetratricopeptide (TPR) repeat protein